MSSRAFEAQAGAGASGPQVHDLSGHSALALLTRARGDLPALFIVSPGRAAVARPADDTPLSAWDVADASAMPFADEAFDLVVLESDAVLGNGDRHLERCLGILQEVNRILSPAGRCVLVAATTRIPRERRKWKDYRLQSPAKTWSRALPYSPFMQARVFPLRYDGPRLAEIDISPGSTSLADANAEAVVLRKLASTCAVESSDGILQELPQCIEAVAGRKTTADRCLVRKIGKTAVFGSFGDQEAYVARIPRSALALNRARTNLAALSTLHASSLSPAWKALIPRPLGLETLNGYHYFVEDLARGLPCGDADPDAPRREAQALGFITELHMATAVVAPLDLSRYTELIAKPLSCIAAICPSAGSEQLDQFLRRALLNRVLPLVSSHGDFALGNCLYENGRLSGVIDWELFTASDLPLVDAVHRIDIPHESSSHPTWQRFDFVFKMLRNEEWRRSAAISGYVDRVGIDPAVVPALLIMHWVDHVAHRIEARGTDAVWLEKRVLHPLRRLTEWLASIRADV